MKIKKFLLVLFFASLVAPKSSFAFDLREVFKSGDSIFEKVRERVEYFFASKVAGVQTDEIKNHVFKFYLDPRLVPDIKFAKTNLPKYVKDMNYVLAKNTNSHLIFNPETDIVLTSTQPQSDSAGILPTEGYEVWAHVAASARPDFPYSYGGRMSFDESGAAVLADLHWTKIFDPDTLTPNSDQTHDYWIQIDHMLHEFAHVFGAGMGEYYNLSNITDSTGAKPILNISLDKTDIFWSIKTNFFADPLLRLAYDNALIGNPTNRKTLLATTKFSDLTAAIINGSYRAPQNLPPTVDLLNLNIKIIDSSFRLPMAGAQVKIWSVGGYPGNPAKLLLNTTANKNGVVTFAWGATGDPHNNYDFLRLVKVTKKGYDSAAKYISIYDTDIQKLVLGKGTYSTTITLLTSTNCLVFEKSSKIDSCR